MRTWMIGTSMLGKRVTGSDWKLRTPSTISTRNSASDGTGWRIDQADMFQFIAPASLTLASGSTVRTASPSRRNVPALATTRSPSASPERTSTWLPAVRPVSMRRVATFPLSTTWTIAPCSP